MTQTLDELDELDELARLCEATGLQPGTRILKHKFNLKYPKDSRSTKDAKDTKGWILYYIQLIFKDRVLYKIGISGNIKKRFSHRCQKELQIKFLYLETGTKGEMFGREQTMHRKYQRYRYQHPALMHNSSEIYHKDVLSYLYK